MFFYRWYLFWTIFKLEACTLFKTNFKKNNFDNILIKTSLCCVCGTDLLKILEKNSFLKRFLNIKRQGNSFLGHEVVGTIEDFNNLKEKKFKIGDRVILIEQDNCKSIGLSNSCSFCKDGYPLLCVNKHKRKYTEDVYGGWSEYFIRNEFQVYKISDKISDEAACLIEPASISYKAVNSIKLNKKDNILLIGSGLISLISIQILRIIYGNDIKIHVIAKHKFQGEEATRVGADFVHYQYSIDKISDNLNTRIIGKKKNLYLNEGFDAIIDFVGSEETNDFGISVLKSKSSFVIVGFNNDKVRVGFDHFIQREIKLIGIHGYDSKEKLGSKNFSIPKGYRIY